MLPVCGFAPGMRKEEFQERKWVPFADPELTNQRLNLFWIGCGTEDGLYGVVADYPQVLDEKGIRHEKYITPGGHTWMNCRLYLSEISRRLFRKTGVCVLPSGGITNEINPLNV